MTRTIDVSHTIHHGMVTYKGLPPPVISDYLSRAESRSRYAPDTEFQIGKLEMVANTGTYIDAPYHRFAERADISQLDLSSVANLEGVVVRCNRTGSPAIDSEAFAGIRLQEKAVLIHSGWDQHWRTEEYSSGKHPFLTASAAELLASSGVRLVGIDSFNIDDVNDGSRPAHTILLSHNIPIVEHLCGLSELPDTGFRFFAVPVKVRGFGSFPVRAFAIVD